MRTSFMMAALAGALLVMVASMAHSRDTATGAFGHEFESIEGGKLAFNTWRGKVLLVVNTASFCGYTRQYQGLQTLWERYEKRGLVVVGVPSNDFGAQEPKSEAEIASFCQGAFGVTFPLTAKVAVAGPQAHPFYRWAREKLGAGSAPRWNFHKYLIGRDGNLIAGYGAGVEPLSLTLTKAIETALGPN
jgi:glutathione peroxidase